LVGMVRHQLFQVAKALTSSSASIRDLPFT
jgi:hypothetical protein